MDWDAFFTVHADLPRQGPGEAADVHWALDVLGVSGSVSVLDAGCGPGADTETLAEALPQARIHAVDTHAPFVDQLHARCARFGDRVSARAAPMQDQTGPYDLIWCAGALYFLGVTEGLRLFRDRLRPGGAVAFSEPVILRDTPHVRAFWEGEGSVTDAPGIRARIAQAGFDTVGERLIVGAPWAAYYGPMQARLDALRGQAPSDAVEQAIDAAQTEIDRWRACPDDIAYLLCAVRPA